MFSNSSFQDPDPDPDPDPVTLLSHNIDLRIWIQIPIHMIIMGLIILVTFIMNNLEKMLLIVEKRMIPQIADFYPD